MRVDDRRAALAAEVSSLVAQGRRIETHDAFQAVLVRGRLVERRELVLVDEAGSVTRQALPVDRERIVMLIGAVVVVIVFMIYIVISAAMGTGDSGGGSPPI